MVEQPPIFRMEAMERISSPERLDHLLSITRPRHWLALGSLAAFVLAAGVWAVWGRLPVTVTGKGVLTYPRTLQPIQSPGDGRLRALRLAAGDVVRRGDIVAEIDRPDLERDLAAARARLAERQRQDARMHGIESRQMALELQELAVALATLDVRRTSCARGIADAEALAPILERRLESQRALRSRGLLPAVSLEALEAEQARMQNESRLNDLRAELTRIELERAQLETRRSRLEQDVTDRASERRNEIEALQGQVNVLEARLEATAVVRSAHAGRVVELLVTDGQQVGPGTRLASVETGERTGVLTCLVYLPVGDGKRVGAGMRLQVTPDVVDRERYGGIEGTVTAVSPFSLTREAVAVAVGSVELATQLTGDEPQMEIVASLATDPGTRSGYKWSSSQGPAIQISAGTTAAVRVTVEERSPITYVLPFLRSLTGVY